MTINVRSLADFKRFLALPGATVQVIRNDWADPAKTAYPIKPKAGYFDQKTVTRLQSNGVWFTTGWLQYPKASLMKFDGDTVTIDMDQDGSFKDLLVYRLTMAPGEIVKELATTENGWIAPFDDEAGYGATGLLLGIAAVWIVVTALILLILSDKHGRLVLPMTMTMPIMMALSSRQDLMAEVKRLSEVATTYMLALGAIADVPARHVERFTIDGARYTLKLYRPADAHGGIVVEYVRIKGQRTLAHAYYLDDMVRDYSTTTGLMMPMKIALERMTMARNRLVRPDGGYAFESPPAKT